ncbi:MAG: site-specific DNA-methyltransferase, partial [Candidatus Methanoplasma sp.]|nr:site-specific DNA-methyltransferase [Candidatus Methanoplasma sp.]
MTSPPYWGKRKYASGNFGQEETYQEYVSTLAEICGEVHRVLKPTGSFWLNVGDTYDNKTLLNIPWRVSIELIDSQKWILRNTVIWNKLKGNPDNASDKLRNMYEPVFHFVKNKKYYYDIDAIRNDPKESTMKNGKPVSATGVSGKKYKMQIESSATLTDLQKENAISELDNMIDCMKKGMVSDFRMIIKGQQRATHSDSEEISGRAKELNAKGFYFLKYNPKGSKPGDIWDIVPEDTQNRLEHYAAYPTELCKNPILLTCPANGVVLDPFCGTGTTMLAAYMLNRKS